MTRLKMRDRRVAGLFVRSWEPAADQGRAPILLLHDSLGCVDLWRGFPETLARATGRAVFAYDRLGFGQSDPHPGTLGLGFVVDEAARAIPRLQEAIGFTRFIACGHSVGGGMGVEAAARYPADCIALVTIGAQAFVEDLTLQGIRRGKRVFATDEGLAKLVPYHGAKARWVVDAWTETWLSAGFADWTLDAALTLVRCPVLAIHGELDEYGSDAHPRRIAGRHGRLELLAGIGHVPQREAEERVVELVRGFLAQEIGAC